MCVFDTGGTTGSTTGAGESGSEEEGHSEADGPRVVDLFANPAMLAEDDAIMITARVTDPDGLDDIVGGVLVDDEEGSVYGAFVQISEGTFQILLTWDSANAAEPIRFEWEGSRTYRAQFEDKDQHAGSLTIDLPFDCGGNSFGVCGDGECRPLGTTSDCEGCDKRCSAVCDEGACVVGEWSSCVVAGDVATCDNACAMLGYDACFAGACDDLGQMGLEAHAGLVYFPADEFGDQCEDAPQYPELVAPNCGQMLNLLNGPLMQVRCCCIPA